MQVIVQNLMTEYWRAGKGDTLLVLHGWGDDSRSWREFGRAMSSTHDVIIPDLPGFGGTQAPDSAWGVTDYAKFVRDLLQKLDVKPKLIVGHSNGGAIAVRGVGRGYLQAQKLLLAASAGVRGTKTRKGLYMVTKVGKVLTTPLPKRVKKQLRSSLYSKAGSDMLVAEHMQETFKRIVRDDVREDAAYISTPTLLLYGETDTETPVSLGRQLASAIEGSQMAVLPGKGHMLHIDALQELVAATEDFIRV